MLLLTHTHTSLVPQTPIQISEGKGVWQHRVQRVVAAEFNNYLRHASQRLNVILRNNAATVQITQR